MVDLNELQKKRVVYKIPGMEQTRVVENRMYKTVDGVNLLLDVYYPVDFQVLVAKAGLDHPAFNTSIDSFIREASAKNVALDFMIHPSGQHAFDVLDDVARSHEIIKRTLEFTKTCLTQRDPRSSTEKR